MKDISKILRQKYFDTLNGSIFSNGVSVGVVTYRGKNDNYPIIILAEDDQSEIGKSKKHFSSQVDITLDIVARFPINTNSGSRITVDNISDQILQELVKIDGTLEIEEGFRNISTNVIQSNNLRPEITDNNVFYRKILRIRHLVQEL